MAATKGYKYLGPSETIWLEEGGKPYHVGDVLPISEEVAAALVRDKHWLEGYDLPSTGEGQSAEMPRDFGKSA